MAKYNCDKCIFSRSVPGDAHTRCLNHYANVKGNRHGIENGWFMWPYNFDPIWLEDCDGYVEKGQETVYKEAMNDYFKGIKESVDKAESSDEDLALMAKNLLPVIADLHKLPVHTLAKMVAMAIEYNKQSQ